MAEHELLPLAGPWSREEWVEFGDRKWNANQAKLTILEGPQLSLQQLAMGRGWRNAERESVEVTEQLLEALRQRRTGAAVAGQPAAPAAPGARAGGAPQPAPAGSDQRQPAGPPADLLADSVGLELLALLDQAPEPLMRAWRLAQARPPARSAAESLAVAERAVRSLLERGLVVLELTGNRRDRQETEPGGTPALAGESNEAILRDPDCWATQQEQAVVLMRRA